jgi:hypothetical protein
MSEEHFGIVVAEMVNSGCIPFVPKGGGQVEIVDRKESLTYSTEKDCARKIGALLSSSKKQKKLVHNLSRLRGNYSVGAFHKKVIKIISNF